MGMMNKLKDVFIKTFQQDVDQMLFVGSVTG